MRSAKGVRNLFAQTTQVWLGRDIAAVSPVTHPNDGRQSDGAVCRADDCLTEIFRLLAKPISGLRFNFAEGLRRRPEPTPEEHAGLIKAPPVGVVTHFTRRDEPRGPRIRTYFPGPLLPLPLDPLAGGFEIC